MFSIKKTKDFKEVYEAKKSIASKNLIMYVLKKENSVMERNRLGISVSHKVGNSVVRHFLIRRIREIFRKNENLIENYYNIVIVLRKGADKAEFKDLNEEFITLCKKQKILREQKLS